MIIPDSPVASDVVATAISGAAALGFLRLWEETAKRGFLDQKVNRKLVHISIGLVLMLCWPLFSSEKRAPFLASLVLIANFVKMLVMGLGLYKDEATVKSMTRYGDYRELIKGPLYYCVATICSGMVYWRTSPIAIAITCNLCAGDGFADLVGRRFRRRKIPYNKNKTIAGSVAMASTGFLASIGFMYYFSLFGFVEASWEMVFSFLTVSLASAVVESLTISTKIDDNLTVPLASMLLGHLIL